jgi:hypothetical protein
MGKNNSQDADPSPYHKLGAIPLTWLWPVDFCPDFSTWCENLPNKSVSTVDPKVVDANDTNDDAEDMTTVVVDA